MNKGKLKFISVRVPSGMKQALIKKATSDHRNLSDYLRLLFSKVIKNGNRKDA